MISIQQSICFLICLLMTAACLAATETPPNEPSGDQTLNSTPKTNLSIGGAGLTALLDPTAGTLLVHDGGTDWTLRSSHGGVARITMLKAEQTSIQEAPPVETYVLGGSGIPVAWSRPDEHTLRGTGDLPGLDLRFMMSFTLHAPNKLACTITVDGPDACKIADMAFPSGPVLEEASSRLVFPQWLGLLVAPGGPDIHVRRILYQRPWCMRFIGGTQETPAGARSFIAIIDDSLYRGADLWRKDHVAGFDFWGDRSYPDRTSDTRTQSLTFEFMDGNYVQIARRYRKWAQQRPTWATFASRIRPVATELVGGAIPFCHVPCDYGGEPLAFDALIPRLSALKEAGVRRAVIHLGGWNRMGYDAEYPDILPANPACGGDEGMARLVQAINELGYLCTPHDDIGIISVNAPSYDEKWPARWFDDSKIDGGVYRETQNHITSGAAQVHFAACNMPMVGERYPGLNGYLFDVTTSVQPLEDYSSKPPVLREEDLALRMEAFKITRDAFASFTMGESIMEWSIQHNDAAFMAEEGYLHQGDGGWAKDDLHGEIVPIWELVYHDSQIGIRDSSTHVNTDMDTQDPLIRYLRVLLKTLRAGTLPPAFFSDDLTLNVMRDVLATATEDAGSWSGMTEWELLATVSCISTWLADEVFHADMVHHEFVEDNLYHEHTRFETPRGVTEVWVNTSLDAWSPQPGLVLPPLGFWIEGPGLCAYHAEIVGEVAFTSPVLAAFKGVFETGCQIESFRAFGGPEAAVPVASGYARVTLGEAGIISTTRVP
jgi:hypothetical protein